MLFYRVSPVPPSTVDLKFWFNGKNIDGLSNSTLTDGQPTNLGTVANLGSAGGSWISSDGVGGNYRPLYHAATHSIQIGTVGGFNRSLGLLSFDQASSVPTYNFTGTDISGFIVLSYHTSIINDGLLWMSIDPTANYFNFGRNTNSNTKFTNNVSNSPHIFNFTPSTGIRYCLSWKRTSNTAELRVKSNVLTTETLSTNTPNALGPVMPVIGTRVANGTPQNAYVESFGIYEGSADLSQIESWVESYYGKLG